jgi:hypothetical protein
VGAVKGIAERQKQGSYNSNGINSKYSEVPTERRFNMDPVKLNGFVLRIILCIVLASAADFNFSHLTKFCQTRSLLTEA